VDPLTRPADGATRGGEDGEPPAGGPSTWRPWTAPAALVAALVVAAVGGLVVDIVALVFGAHVTSSHLPDGLEIADTAVQDCAFVAVAVFFAGLGGQRVSAAQLGLRPTRAWRALGLALLTVLGFLVFSATWGVAFHVEKEKLLEQLGTRGVLVVLSAALTCVLAPVCEEILFRGYFFAALRNWRGVWPAAGITGLAFGAVHAGSAPAIDLVPLAVLGFALCLLYQRTGSLYPCIAAHSLNNSLAFGALEDWTWQIPVLMVSALAIIFLVALVLMRAGVLSAAPKTAWHSTRAG
jgi:membrane protease YdiL (CAAX protease family)